MNIEKSQNIVPDIRKTVARLSKPWTSIGENAPLFSVKEVARKMGTGDYGVVARAIIGDKGNGLILQEPTGNEVMQVTQSALNVAPYKRAVREAGYRSRAPGGGPVVKRRLDETDFSKKKIQLGIGKLTIAATAPENPADLNKKRRDKIEERLALRWQAKTAKPVILENEADFFAQQAITYLKSICEKDGFTDEEQMQQRLIRNIEACLSQPVLFVWGPPYEQQNAGKPEQDMVEWITKTLTGLKQTGFSIYPMLLYGDYYGGKINGMNPDLVNQYLNQVVELIAFPVTIIKWSELRQQNSEQYQKIASNLAPFSISQAEVTNAKQIKRKLGAKISNQEAQNLASMYVRERLIEGTLLTEGFSWNNQQISDIIKFGTAPSKIRNDDPYESGLPRFYVKDMPRAAWNKPR